MIWMSQPFLPSVHCDVIGSQVSDIVYALNWYATAFEPALLYFHITPVAWYMVLLPSVFPKVSAKEPSVVRSSSHVSDLRGACGEIGRWAVLMAGVKVM